MSIVFSVFLGRNLMGKDMGKPGSASDLCQAERTLVTALDLNNSEEGYRFFTSYTNDHLCW